MRNGSGRGNKIRTFADIAMSLSKLISRQMARKGIVDAPFKQRGGQSSA